MGDTTSIDDLPTDPTSGNMNNNVVLQKMELSTGAGGMGVGMGMGMGMGMQSQGQTQTQGQGQVYNPNISSLGVNGPMQPPQMQQPSNIMNEMISGLQRASASGMTALPSRDIPMNTSNMMNDAQVKPNFIPTPQTQQAQQVNQFGPRPMPSNNYIEEHEQDVTSEDKYKKSQIANSQAENIYKLIQIPVVVGILYFAFQLPVTRKYILKFIPSVFNSDGNYNISGLIFMSALFSLSFFGLSKVLEMSETW
jgi:hypothetical protein